MKHVDSREREQEILDLVIACYIQDPRPVGSTYLCSRYNLPYSSATVRAVMESLEKKGLLSHRHTSSGRVPTREGFKYYAGHLTDRDFVSDMDSGIDWTALESAGEENFINATLDALARMSGYTSLVVISTHDSKIFFRGARFILEQPEFCDIAQLKNLFYILEVKIDRLQSLLFRCCDERMKIFVGDEIGVAEIDNCSLVVSGARDNAVNCSLALLGPMRMDYTKAASCVYSVREQFLRSLEHFL